MSAGKGRNHQGNRLRGISRDFSAYCRAPHPGRNSFFYPNSFPGPSGHRAMLDCPSGACTTIPGGDIYPNSGSEGPENSHQNHAKCAPDGVHEYFHHSRHRQARAFMRRFPQLCGHEARACLCPINKLTNVTVHIVHPVRGAECFG